MRDGKVNKIIALDTGHLGFEMDGLADEVLVDRLPEYEKRHVDCAEDTKPGSDFLTALTEGFSSANCKLVSLAAAGDLEVSSSVNWKNYSASIRKPSEASLSLIGAHQVWDNVTTIDTVSALTMA